MNKLICSLVLSLLWIQFVYSQEQDNQYHKPLQAIDYSIKETVVESRRIGNNVLREHVSLGVEVLIKVKNYLPRALEPVLIVDGKKIGYSIGVIGVGNNVTTLGFIVPEQELLKDGQNLVVQMGEDKKTRSLLRKPINRKAIRPLDKESVIKLQNN